MTHLELENLASEYLEGRLDAVDRAGVEEHLAACAACREVLGDIRDAIEICHSAGEVTPPPWLVPKILRATVGEKPAGSSDQMRSLLRSFRQPRLAYAVAMALFSISLIANVAGFKFRNLNLQELNPTTWVYRANRAGHLLYARVEKFYDDLRIVYEIESRFRNTQSQPAEHENQTSKPSPSEGRPASTTDRQNARLAYDVVNAAEVHAQPEQGVQTNEMR